MVKMFRYLEDEIRDEDELDQTNSVKNSAKNVQPIRDAKEIIPFSDFPLAKDIARNPFTARIVFFLEDHGASSEGDMNKALGISYGSIWYNINKLQKKGFPIVQIKKSNQLDERFKYFDLKRLNRIDGILEGQQDFDLLKNMLIEIHEWYDYFALTKFEKALSEYEWLDLKTLQRNFRFIDLVERWGYDFRSALRLLLSNGLVYLKREGDNITHIKRAFDNYGKSIEESDLGMAYLFEL